MSIINRSELDRIRQTLEPPTEYRSKAERKAELKQKSNERLQHWPNTLEALRKKKESFIKDKAAREEEARRLIDSQEAEFRKSLRLESIQRANQLLYEQTDKMKMLRSQQLYSDVLYDRSGQVLQKHTMTIAIEEKEKAYHEDLMAQIRDAELKEKQQLEAQRQYTELIVKTREEQLKEARLKKQREKEEERFLGLQIAKAAEQHDKEDLKLQEEMMLKSKMRAAEMIEENKKILEWRQKRHQRELDDEQEKAREMKVAQDREYARKALEKRRFEKAQATRQRMIDAAVISLTKQINDENRLLEKQELEMKDKTDREFREKEERSRLEWEKCVESRNQQLQEKKLRFSQEEAEEERYYKLQREQAEQEEKLERERDEKSKASIKAIKALQLQEAIDAQRRKVEQLILEREEAKILRELVDQDEKKFQDIVDGEIEKYTEQGKPVYTLRVAKEIQPPDLLPAILVRKNNRKYQQKQSQSR